MKRRTKPQDKLMPSSSFDAPDVSHRRPKSVDFKPKNKKQSLYIKSLDSNILTFGIGPAGTGKTYIAARRAAQIFAAGDVERIYVTRPAVEAGESLGFLPGKLDEKFEPYFRPVREALAEELGTGPLEYAIKAKQIEGRPLALLRGATFKNAVVILDEAQNTTPLQMKLFLTRIGENCRVIVNGDPDQQDIPGRSGLMDAVDRLAQLASVGIVRFHLEDVVRSGLCMEILRAYSTPDACRSIHDYRDDDGLLRVLAA